MLPYQYGIVYHITQGEYYMETAIEFGYGYKEYYDKNYFKYTEHDVKSNDPRSYYDLAEYYRNSSDAKNANIYYKKAYDSFYSYISTEAPEIYYYLGYFYQYGYGVEANQTKAEEYYTKAYNQLSKYQGKPLYQYLLGRLYESGYHNGKIGKPDYKKAASYYGLAASFGYTDAYYRLGYVDALLTNGFHK